MIDRAMRIAFLGFGQIAGSVALALRASPDERWRAARLVAWSPTGGGPDAAARDGVLDAAAADPAAALAGADLVVLGAPPLRLIELVRQLGDGLRSAVAANAVVTDVGSTKAAVVAAAERAGIRFVGGHPMAGGEQPGYVTATAALFGDRPWIVVPTATANGADVDLVRDLARACGARPMTMSAADHDAATAAISHLPLVASAALVEAVAGTAEAPRPDWPLAARLAAGGWASMTRLARGDVAMDTGIAATNAGPLAARIRALRASLDEWLAELERPGGPDPERLAARFAAVRTFLAPDDQADDGLAARR